MREGLSRRVVFDTTVLSNFGSVDAIDWLLDSFERPSVVPAVRDELERGLKQGHQFLEAAKSPVGSGLHLLRVTSDRPNGLPRHLASLDPGEAESLLAAEEYGCTLASDDHEAREITNVRGVPVTGSVGILGRGVRRGELDVETADAWLHTWMSEFGYRSPVESVSELVEESQR